MSSPERPQLPNVVRKLVKVSGKFVNFDFIKSYHLFRKNKVEEIEGVDLVLFEMMSGPDSTNRLDGFTGEGRSGVGVTFSNSQLVEIVSYVKQTGLPRDWQKKV